MKRPSLLEEEQKLLKHLKLLKLLRPLNHFRKKPLAKIRTQQTNQFSRLLIVACSLQFTAVLVVASAGKLLLGRTMMSYLQMKRKL